MSATSRHGTEKPSQARGMRRTAAAGWLARVALACALLTSAGCGTLITQFDGPLFEPGKRAFNWDEEEASPIYSGVRLSWGGARKSEVYFIFIADLPFSLIADTILLPLTVTQEALAFFLAEEPVVVRPPPSP